MLRRLPHPSPLLAAALLLSACGSSSTKLEDLNTTIVTLPDGNKIVAETMVRDIDLQRGMMFRDALPDGHGMILIEATMGKFPVWTYNCRIPLDVVWINSGLRVVEILTNLPPCPSSSAKSCPRYGGKEQARYVLELKGGDVARYGLKVGDTLSF